MKDKEFRHKKSRHSNFIQLKRQILTPTFNSIIVTFIFFLLFVVSLRFVMNLPEKAATAAENIVSADISEKLDVLDTYLLDSNNKKVNAQVVFSNATQSKPGEPKTKAVVTLEKTPVSKIEFEDVDRETISKLRVDSVSEKPKQIEEGITSLKTYAIDPTQVNFTSATVTVSKAKGNSLLKCKEWDFENQKCNGEWNKLQAIVPGQEYSFELTQDDPGFAEIIEVTKAMHLDSKRNIVSDIYSQVSQLDDVWSETIPSGDYVRITFEKNLTSSSDMILYSRTVSGKPRIFIYEVNQSIAIAEFTDLNSSNYNQIFLTGLIGSQNTFDLFVKQGDVELDYIVDPKMVNFTATQTYTVPAGITTLIVEAWGAGGGGGGSSTSRYGGSGGAGGQYVKKTLSPVTPTTKYTIKIGAAGAAGAATAGTGGPGGNTTFNTTGGTILVRAVGGRGGGGGSSTATGPAGYGNTTGAVGDVIYKGGNGVTGSRNSNVGGGGGGGGAGSTALGKNASGITGGAATTEYGGGGGDGLLNNPGGTGELYGGAGAGGEDGGSDAAGGAGYQGYLRITEIPSLSITASSINKSNVRQRKININWTTTADSNTTLNFGKTLALGTKKILQAAVTAHNVSVYSQLAAGTLYYYNISSCNDVSCAVNGSFQFTTKSNVTITALNKTSVRQGKIIINWTTNVAGNTSINYGKTAALGTWKRVLAPVTLHNVTLLNLVAGTTYYYNISTTYLDSTKINNSLTFTTKSNVTITAGTINKSSVTNQSININWTTNIPSNTTVRYGTAKSLASSRTIQAAVTAHNVTLQGLTAGTLYYYNISSAYLDSRRVNGSLTFTTKSNIQIVQINKSTVRQSKIIINWTTNLASNTSINYGKTLALGEKRAVQNSVTLHNFTLLNLVAGTKYYYNVSSCDTATRLCKYNGTFTFRTNSNVTIGQINKSEVRQRRIIINWTTNNATNTSINYGLTTQLGTWKRIENAVTLHNITLLTGLKAGTTYYYNVSSTFLDSAQTNGSFTFSTKANISIGQINKSSVKNQSIIINWTTNNASNTSINYGINTQLGTKKGLTELVSLHNITVKPLVAGTKYYYNITSCYLDSCQVNKSLTFMTKYNLMIGQLNKSEVRQRRIIINWTTNNASNTTLSFGKTLALGASIKVNDAVTLHNVTILSGLAAGTKYYYNVTSCNAETGQCKYNGSFTFRTNSNITIVQLNKSSITQSHIVINWSTNNASNSSIFYGKTAALGTWKVITAASQSHNATLLGLTAGTTYYYNISTTYLDSSKTNGTYTFRTKSNITIGQINKSSVTNQSIIINWTTNNASNTSINYGINTELGTKKGLTALVSLHNITVKPLVADKLYYYNITSCYLESCQVNESLTFKTKANLRIGQLNKSTIRQSKIIINWTTNNASNTSIYYGKTLALGSSVKVNNAVTLHNVTLLGLKAGTTYYYNITSCSAETSQCIINGSFTFLTKSNLTIGQLNKSTIRQSKIIINWSTNNASNISFSYGKTKSLGTLVKLDTASINHNVTLLGLKAGTTYYYNITATYLDSNQKNGTYNFTTKYNVTIGQINKSSITQSKIIINWSTNNASNSTINYGKTKALGTPRVITASSQTHNITLLGLKAGTLYYYNITTTYLESNEINGSFTFTTKYNVTIGRINKSSITQSRIIINWSTNNASNSSVNYGKTLALGTWKVITPASQAHNATFLGLKAGTLYYYNISTTYIESTETNGTLTFSTKANISIGQINKSAVRNQSIIINWTTNNASNTSINYGINTELGTKKGLTALVSLHNITVKPLLAEKRYYYNITSCYLESCQVNESLTFLTKTNLRIGQINRSSVKATSIIINWTTNNASNTSINYGADTHLGTWVKVNNDVVLHNVTLLSLTAETPYYFNVSSCTKETGQCITNGSFTFTTHSSNSAPVIIWVNASPNPALPTQRVNFTANVSEDVAMSKVWFEFKGVNRTMKQDAATQIYYNDTVNISTLYAGTYLLRIFANDTGGLTATDFEEDFNITSVTSIQLISSPVNFTEAELGAFMNATQGYGYPLFIKNTGNVNISLNISGTNLSGTSDQTKIDVKNVEWAATELFNPFKKLDYNQSNINLSLSIRRNTTVFFRIRIPESGLKSQNFFGNLTFTARS